MNKINDKMILKLSDTLHDAAMLYYYGSINEEVDNTRVTNYNLEKGRLNYYESLLQVINYFLEIDDINSSHLEEGTIEKITTLFKKLDQSIEENGLNSEEVRKALLLLDIKGFKNLNYPLDLITPDNVGYIISKIVEAMYKNKKINLLDFNVGVGNLLFTIVNNIDNEVEMVGIDNHALMARVVTSKANLLQEQMVIYHQDALEIIPSGINLVVSDIAAYEYENQDYSSELYDEGVRYFPYLAIEHYLNIKNPCTYIYIIDSDFFSKFGNDKFKNMLGKKATLKAFVTLPPDMFQKESEFKSLLILNNTPRADKEMYMYESSSLGMHMYVLPSLKKKNAFLNKMSDLLNELLK